MASKKGNVYYNILMSPKYYLLNINDLNESKVNIF